MLDRADNNCYGRRRYNTAQTTHLRHSALSTIMTSVVRLSVVITKCPSAQGNVLFHVLSIDDEGKKGLLNYYHREGHTSNHRPGHT